MTFVKWTMLIGLSAVAIPIIIHLLNRRKAQVVDWGAMKFLLGSLVNRNRRMLIEEMLLLALRCLLLALVALAMARPFIPSGSRIPWAVLLPAVLLAAAAFGVGTALWRRLKWRWTLYGLGLLLLILASTAVAAERWLQLRRWVGAGGGQDVALIIDGSASMTLTVDDKTNFERAVEEARTVVDSLNQGDAVSIIVAGPAPQVVTPAPIIDRAEIHAFLDGLTPTRGSLAVLDALNAASITLAEGQNPVKKIVLITDGQNVGWDTSNRARWEFLAEALGDLGTPPRLVCRTLSLPETFRNVAVADVTIAPEIIGPDRDATIAVRVENTGQEPIDRFLVELEVDGETDQKRAVEQLSAGSADTVTFQHRFHQGGPHVVRARAAIRDDLPADDTCVRVAVSLDRLPVLIVDGNPAALPWDRASWFIKVNLDPFTDPDPFAKDDPEKEGGEGNLFVRAKVIDAPNITRIERFGDYSVVILANVPKLPAAVAKELTQFVAKGGGLLIAPGDRAEPEFYNTQWRTPHELPVPPATLDGRRVFAKLDESAKPAVSTFGHQALAKVGDTPDIDTATLTAYWRLGVDEHDGSVTTCGRLDTADPLVVERSVGKGRVLMTAMSLDSRGSNLPTLKSFVVLVHELAFYLLTPSKAQWNFEPASELALPLRTETHGAGAAHPKMGLRGDYYEGRNLERFRVTRIDPAVNFRWTRYQKPPVRINNFSVRWTGSIVPHHSEDYRFHLRAGRGGRLWIDGTELAFPSRTRGHSAPVALTAGKRHDLRVEFRGGGSSVAVSLFWASASQPSEIVPADCLSPARPVAKQVAQTNRAELTVPGGSKRDVKLPAQGGSEEGTILVRIKDAIEPGLYRLRLPEGLAQSLGHLLDRQGAVPFAVIGDVEEGRLTELTQTELDNVAEYTDLFCADSPEQMVAAVAGGVPGHELWKYLAVAALAAVLGEIALTRWIARQRKVGATETVHFDSGAVDPIAYRKRAREMLRVGGPE